MRYGTLDRFVVPINAPQARRYFTDCLYVPQGLRGRLRRAVGSPRLRHTAEVCGLDPLLPLLDEFPAGVPARAAAIYLRDYPTSRRGRVLGFFFEDGSTLPLSVAKAQHPCRDTSLRTEAEALERMVALLPPVLKATLPRVVGFHSSRRGELLVTAALRGRSGYVEVQRSLTPWRNVDAHFQAAARWLVAFHDATRSSATERIGGHTVPHSASHGDFWMRNVLLDAGGRVGVVDWEHFIPAASPFIDLFHYALTYGLSYPWRAYRRAPPVDAFRRTFFETNPVSRAVRRYLRCYVGEMGLPPAVIEPALRQFVATRGQMHGGVGPRPGTADFPWEGVCGQTPKWGLQG